MSARAIHTVEYAVIALALAGLAWVRGGELGAAFWILLVAPDIGLVVAPLLGPMPGRGAIPARAVPMYNLKRGPSPGKLFHDKGRGNGYIVTYGGKRFYISGDTEGTPEMRQLKNIDVAFVCMNLPYTMPPEEAADAVKAFHPKIVIPYHYRGSDLSVFQKALEGTGIEVRLLEWYPK